MIITGKLDQPMEFSRFVLTAKIAAGGMATVYLAEARPGDPLHGRRLAVKVLHDHLAEDDDFVRMFRDEGKIAALFDHSNVVRVFEVGEWQGSHFLLMEFIEGRDLAQLIQALRLHKTVMAPGIAFEILRQALTALSYVHAFKAKNGRSAGVVHRDISPQNLLISRHPLVKLTDFGIARGSHRSDRTRTGTIKGKMHYMAPEQALGERVDARADLYSLGAVAFEMLTGQAAFGPSNTELAHRRVIEGDVDFNAKFRQQPEDVRGWLCRAMARNPDERFQSADAMLAAMEQLGKASRTLYRPEALLRLLELPEASRTLQRQAQRELFLGDDAANLRRLAGAVQTGNHPGGHHASAESRVSSVTGRPQNELGAEDRAARMLKPVVWDAPEPELRPVTDVRVSQPISAIMAKPRQRAAEMLPAEKAVGKSYQVPMSPAGAESAPLQPQRLGSPAPELRSPDLAEVKQVARAASTKIKVSRTEVDQRRGMVMATAVAWMCGAFILFAVLLEVVGWTPELPVVDERSVAALFDGDDAPSHSAGSSLVSEGSGARSDAGAPVGPALPPVFELPRPSAVAPALHGTPTVAEAAQEADDKVVVERRMRKLVERGVERDLWDARPIDRVIAADAPDPEKPVQPKGVAKVAQAAVVAAKARAVAVPDHPALAQPQVAHVAAPKAAVARPAIAGAHPAVPAAKPAQPVVVAAKPQIAVKPVVVAAAPKAVAAKALAAPVGVKVVAVAKPMAPVAKPAQLTKPTAPAVAKPVVTQAKPAMKAKPVVQSKQPAPAKPVAHAKPVVPAKSLVQGKSPVQIKAGMASGKPGIAQGKSAPGKAAPIAAKPGKPVVVPAKPRAQPVVGKPAGGPAPVRPGAAKPLQNKAVQAKPVAPAAPARHSVVTGKAAAAPGHAAAKPAPVAAARR